MSSTLRNTARQEKRTITEPEGTAYAGRSKGAPALESDEERSRQEIPDTAVTKNARKIAKGVKSGEMSGASFSTSREKSIGRIVERPPTGCGFAEHLQAKGKNPFNELEKTSGKKRASFGKYSPSL